MQKVSSLSRVVENLFTRTIRAAVVIDHWSMASGMEVLDMGSGPGRLSVSVATMRAIHVRMVAVAIQAGMLQHVEEKAKRQVAMQAALKVATDVPLTIAQAAVKVMDLCMPAAENGNKWAVSDAGVAVLVAEAALRSAALNVLINLGTLKDPEFVADRRAKLESLLEGKGIIRDQIYDFVASKL